MYSTSLHNAQLQYRLCITIHYVSLQTTCIYNRLSMSIYIYIYVLSVYIYIYIHVHIYIYTCTLRFYEGCIVVYSWVWYPMRDSSLPRAQRVDDAWGGTLESFSWRSHRIGFTWKSQEQTPYYDMIIRGGCCSPYNRGFESTRLWL